MPKQLTFANEVDGAFAAVYHKPKRRIMLLSEVDGWTSASFHAPLHARTNGKTERFIQTATEVACQNLSKRRRALGGTRTLDALLQ
jgi:hypothetical protein